MEPHQVACPQCSTPLRSSKPIPAGRKVKCPRCGLLFSTAHPNGISPPHALAAAPIPPVPTQAVAAPAAIQRAPHAFASPANSPRAPAPAGKRVALLAVGLMALLGVAVGAVILGFSGDSSEATAPPQAEDKGFTPSWDLPVAKKKKPAPQPLIVLPPEQQKKVDEAVKRGVAFLKRQQLASGAWKGHPLGVASLAGLALLESGLKPDDPAVVKAAKFVRGKIPSFTSGHETYELSLAILFLDRLGEVRDRPLIQEMALRLVAAQGPGGGWGYRAVPLATKDREQLYGLLKDLKDHSPEAALVKHGGPEALAPALRGLPVLGGAKGVAAKGLKGGREDNSNTQFAVLALWAARKHDVPLDKTLALVNKRFRSTQAPNGGWSYLGKPKPLTATMTCAGLLGLAVGFGLDRKSGRPAEDAQVQKGLKYLAQSIGEPGGAAGKPLPRQELYLMWSIERVGVLYQLKTIDSKKWYEWGVEMLTGQQKADGSWSDTAPGGIYVDTSFALLFLVRANLAQDLTDKLEELNARPAVVAAPPAGKQ